MQDFNFSVRKILYGWNVILPPGISQMKALLSSEEMPLKRPPFLDISARVSLPSGSESRHFEIFSCSPFFQVQTPPLFHKPMCHVGNDEDKRVFFKISIFITNNGRQNPLPH